MCATVARVVGRQVALGYAAVAGTLDASVSARRAVIGAVSGRKPLSGAVERGGPVGGQDTSGGRPSGQVRFSETTLVYELLDAHADTAELAVDLASEPVWAEHLDYLRALQRRGRRALAEMSQDEYA